MVGQADYQDKTGYLAGADLGLGCGTPVDYADLPSGEIVLDLGKRCRSGCHDCRAISGGTGENCRRGFHTLHGRACKDKCFCPPE